MRTKIFLVVTILIAGSLVSCNQSPLGFDVGTIAISETPMSGRYEPEPSPTPEEIKTDRSTPSAVLPLETKSNSNPLCIPENELQKLEKVPFTAYPEKIIEFINSGGKIELLDQSLYAAGVLSQPTGLIASDLTGDGRLDIAISLFDPDSQSNPPSGVLLIYTCVTDHYVQSYHSISESGWGAPNLHSVQDLNADGASEIVSSSSTCGAHTCFEDFQILEWDGVTYPNRLIGDTRDLPYPFLQLLDDDGDRIYEIRISGSGVGSVGAGPQRNSTKNWLFDPEKHTWDLQAELLEPSKYRIHMLHDADNAAQESNFESALILYQRVINDFSLLDWSDPELERAVLAGYARFQTIAIYLQLGQSNFAQNVFQELLGSVPEENLRIPFVEYAQKLLELEDEFDMDAACQIIRDIKNPSGNDVFRILGSQHFGYSNPDFTLNNLCPWVP